MPPENKTPEQLAEEIKTHHAQALDKVKAQAEEALGKSAAAEKLSEQLKGDIDESLSKFNTLTEQVTALEQKSARPLGGADEVKSFGEEFTSDDRVKSFLDSNPNGGSTKIHIKSALSPAVTDGVVSISGAAGEDGSVGAAARIDRRPGVIELPQQRLTIRQLLMPGTTDGSSVEYIRETGFTNNAGPVAENERKPQSSIQFAQADAKVRTIAHWIAITKQALADVPMIRSLIDTRLRYGLALKEEMQILYGDGTGENLPGISTQATPYAQPEGAAVEGETAIDRLRLAQLQAVLAEYPASAHVLNPVDWANIELTKDAEGRHIIGRPQEGTVPTLWRLPVVETQAQTVGSFLTGAFSMGAQVFDREESSIEVGWINEQFIHNQLTILCEERIALAVYRPESFIKGALPQAQAA